MTQATKAKQRRSGRIPRELPIQVSGIDAMGHDFTSRGRTIRLSRYGAEIMVGNELVPDQEVSIGLLGNSQDWDARIVALFSKRPEGFAYGIEFLFQDGNFWGITFPPAAGSEAAETNGSAKSRPAENEEKFASLLDGDLDFDKLLKKARQTAHARNYALRMKCPHLEAHGGGGASRGDDDQWLVLHRRNESLQQILETAWDFACPIHGAQREFPLEAKEIEDRFEVRFGGGKQAASHGSATGRGGGKPAPKPRREPRLPEVLRVSVRGVDLNGNPFRQSAHSVDISRNGGRLEGLGLITLPGATIEVRRNWRKALFRIVWTGKKGTATASQIGIVCLEPGKNVWNLPDKN